MVTFTNPFFSIAGQVERLKNVGATLNAAFNPLAKGGVVADTGNKTIDKVLGTIASHPYVAAAIPALALNPAVALPVIKAVLPQTAKGQVIAAVASIPVAGIVVQAVANKPTEVLDKALSAPEQAFDFGKQIGGLATEPSLDKGIQILKEHPGASISVLLGLLIAAGYTSASAISLYVNYMNTQAIKKNNELMANPPETPTPQPYVAPTAPQAPTPYVPPQTNTPSTAVVAPPTTKAEVAPAVVTPTKKKTTKKKTNKKKAKKKTTKKKTRRSKKKKSIKRRKTKK